MIDTVEKIYVNSQWTNEYKVTFSNGTLSCVPNDEANTDYQAIQEWAAIEGNNIIDPGA
jgi:hypothetical protein